METEELLRWTVYKVAVGARGGGTMEVPGFMKRAAHTEEAYQLGTEQHDAQEGPASRAGDPRGGGGLRLYINDHHRIALRAQERFEESMETARLLVDGCAVLLNLEHAREEMDKGEKTLSEIAVSVGFSDSRAMAKAFTKHFGMLPSEYLKISKK